MSPTVTTASVTSADGTTIGYRQLGSGPGLIVVHGAMESSVSHLELAEALADSFTVFLVDRRGRGLSGPYPTGYDGHSDVDDLNAVIEATGAKFVFGVSSGAIVCLKAALANSTLSKVAIFEPPLVINGSLSTDFIARYETEIAAGDTASAMVTGMLGAQMGPPIFAKIPRPVLRWLTNKMMKSEDKKSTPDDVTMRLLAPTLHYDFALVLATDDAPDCFANITAELLLLNGTKSPAYLRGAVAALATAFPGATHAQLTGLNHGGSGNRNRGGKPQVVASTLREFFA